MQRQSFFFFTQRWKRKKKERRGGFAERTLYGELGLCFDGGVGVAGRAGVDAAVLLCQVGDLEASSSHELQAAHAGSTEWQSLRGGTKKEIKKRKEIQKLVQSVNKLFRPVPPWK